MTSADSCRFPNHYDIIKKIGRGGTADIYLAHRKGCSRPVVIKKFFDNSAENLIKRELKAAQRINFPGLVRVFGSERTADDEPFLWMEYCPGPTLDELPGPLPEDKLLAILSALAVSLDVLHRSGLVHNDIKPANIFCPPGFENDDFSLEGPFYLKLADLSLSIEYRAETVAKATGTVGYMSPEMIRQQEATPASDLFSMGVLAYRLACGHLPFESESGDPLEINARVTEGRRPKLDGPGKKISEEAAELIMSLLAVDPGSRPASAFELVEMLAKCGSPYHFREAIRPRHLLSGREYINGEVLEEIFGTGSFSPEQLKYMEKINGLEPHNTRILLEDNFDHGNFARLDGRWGWKNDGPEVIYSGWRQAIFGLRPLRQTALSVKKFALSLALADDPSYAGKIADSFGDVGEKVYGWWQNVPEKCRPALLYNLKNTMRPGTGKILAGRLIDNLGGDDIDSGFMGRLYYYAGCYREAVEHFRKGIDESGRGFDHEKTFGLIDLAYSASCQIDDLPAGVEIWLKKARLQKELGDFGDSEKTYEEIVEMIRDKDYPALLAQTYKEMGDLYKLKNDYAMGIRVLGMALEAYQTLDDPLALSNTYNNLGNMYWIAGDLDRSLENYQQALEIHNRLEAHKYIATSLNNIGSIYVIKGDYDSGLDYYQRSLELRQRMDDKGSIAQSWNNLGAVHFLRGDAGRAADSFRQSLKLNREVGAKAEELLNIENLAEASIMAGRLTEALGFLKEGTALAQKLDETSHRSTINRLTGQLLRRMGYYEESEDKLREALKLALQIENKALVLMCRLEMARLYLSLREEKALDKAVSEGNRLAREMGDKNALFHLALVRLARSGAREDQNTAETLVDDLGTERDRALLYLYLLERNNHQQATSGSGDYAHRSGKFFEAQAEDIDTARYYLALADYYRLTDEGKKGADYALTAAEISGKLRLLPEQWRALVYLSEVSFEARDYETAFTYARQATDCVKKVAGHIKGSDRLGRFYNDRRITALLGRIKSLQAILSKMKGAAVGSP